MKRILISLVAIGFIGFGMYWLYEYAAGSTEISFSDHDDPKTKLCKEAINQIRKAKTCAEQKQIYEKNRPTCQNQDIVSKEEILVFDDLSFEIADCFRKSKQEKEYSEELLKIAGGEAWERQGPTSCSPQEEAKARIEAITFSEKTCSKESVLEGWKGQAIDISISSLQNLARKDHAVSFGSWESDDACILPFTAFEDALTRLQGLKVAQVDKTDAGFTFVHFENEKRAKDLVLGFEKVGDCLVLDGVYLPSTFSD